jgi:hypothetical protein
MDIINKLEYSFELVLVILLALILIYNSTLFEEIFPPNTIINYNSRIWHLLLLLIVLSSYLWSNKVGILLLGLYILYILDMDTLINMNM